MSFTTVNKKWPFTQAQIYKHWQTRYQNLLPIFDQHGEKTWIMLYSSFTPRVWVSTTSFCDMSIIKKKKNTKSIVPITCIVFFSLLFWQGHKNSQISSINDRVFFTWVVLELWYLPSICVYPHLLTLLFVSRGCHLNCFHYFLFLRSFRFRHYWRSIFGKPFFHLWLHVVIH